jgi:hypothetical protein
MFASDKATGIAENGSRWHGATETCMERHDRALAETDQREARCIKVEARKFGIDKGINIGFGGDGIVIKFGIIAGTFADPLEAAIFCGRWTIGRDEGDFWHGSLPIIGEGHEIGT